MFVQLATLLISRLHAGTGIPVILFGHCLSGCNHIPSRRLHMFAHNLRFNVMPCSHAGTILTQSGQDWWSAAPCLAPWLALLELLRLEINLAGGGSLYLRPFYMVCHAAHMHIILCPMHTIPFAPCTSCPLPHAYAWCRHQRDIKFTQVGGHCQQMTMIRCTKHLVPCKHLPIEHMMRSDKL